ncbi:MAG: hypothetical protein IPM78_09245 [Moraxellaceae bacterium]|nr:hypothetical protein [Moraxellaceae bacterium]
MQNARQSLAQCPVSQQSEALPKTAFTLHRLLGMGLTQPKFNAQQPLAYDLIIIDEASMIDLDGQSTH